MTDEPTDSIRLRTALLLLLVLSLCLYLPSLDHNAFADDEIYLAFANRFLREAGWTELYQLFLGPTNRWEFLPARDFTYWLDFRIYGDEPAGFHLTNLLWYAASCAAAGFMIKEAIFYCNPLWRRRAGILALVGTLVFAAHPAHVEAVVWIASRKDLMSGTFGMLTLWALLGSFHGGVRRERVACAVLFFLMACFSKAASVTFVVLVGLIIFSSLPRLGAHDRRVALLYGCVFLAICGLSVAIHASVAEDRGISVINDPGILAMVDRGSRILASLGLILVSPYPLRLYHDAYLLGAWHWWVSGAMVLSAVLGAVAFVCRRQMWGLSVLLMVLPLFFYLQFVPFTTWSLASERFVFVPVAGLALLVADICGRCYRPRYILASIVVAVACSAGIVWQRIGEWEYGYHLLELEYERQPGFHNAIRDRIVQTLLPQMRYEEAASLAQGVGRDYAAHALLTFVDTERIFREAEQRIPGGLRDANVSSRNEFCGAVSRLSESIRRGRQAIAVEPDVSFNNILGTLERYKDQRYGDWKWMCV